MPANAHADDQLLQLALSDRIISEADLAEAEAGLADHAGEATSVYDYLVKQGKLDTADLMVRLADQFGMTTVDVDHLDIPEDVLGLITRSQAVHYQLLPLARRGDSLEVALADPLSTDGVDTLAHLLQISIVPRLASAESILLADRPQVFEPPRVLVWELVMGCIWIAVEAGPTEGGRRPTGVGAAVSWAA